MDDEVWWPLSNSQGVIFLLQAHILKVDDTYNFHGRAGHLIIDAHLMTHPQRHNIVYFLLP